MFSGINDEKQVIRTGSALTDARLPDLSVFSAFLFYKA